MKRGVRAQEGTGTRGGSPRAAAEAERRTPRVPQKVIYLRNRDCNPISNARDDETRR